VFLSLNQWCTSPLRLQASDCSISLACAMFPGWQLFAMNLWNACLVFLPGIFSVLWLLFLWLQWHFMFHIRWIFMYNFYILIYFPLLYVLHSYLMALIHLQVCKFSPFYFWLLYLVYGDPGSRPGLASGICGGQSGVGAGFLRVLQFSLPKPFIPPTSPSS
jgi:hypothetical protein